MMKYFFDLLLKALLIIVFALIITPIGLLLRLFGVDYMDRKMDSNASSYWKGYK